MKDLQNLLLDTRSLGHMVQEWLVLWPYNKKLVHWFSCSCTFLSLFRNIQDDVNETDWWIQFPQFPYKQQLLVFSLSFTGEASWGGGLVELIWDQDCGRISCSSNTAAAFLIGKRASGVKVNRTKEIPGTISSPTVSGKVHRYRD